ncbi:DUF4352 domain-containing protein [Haladaptatus sp. DYF46]|uniref:DUF4352 domain-containing protein n=1 Tax=Haladaptatus sp. DYF46 TaxID=2886041 RepID=UPI001E32B82A|nr:DUF4352 domain-containing protein [Haladaptatus sp. DYF46]
MERRTFIASTTSAVLLAGCSSSGNDTTSTTTTTDQSTTKTTDKTTETTTESETTTSETTTAETTDETTTSESTTTKRETRTVAFQQYVNVGNGLEVAVTKGDVSGSYKHDGTTTKSGDGKTFVLATFEAKNSAESSQSLPEGTTASIQADNNQYDVAEPAAKKWQQFVSSSVNSGGSASTSVAFEVPKEAVSSLGVAVQLTYTDSGAKQIIQWNME